MREFVIKLILDAITVKNNRFSVTFINLSTQENPNSLTEAEMSLQPIRSWNQNSSS